MFKFTTLIKIATFGMFILTILIGGVILLTNNYNNSSYLNYFTITYLFWIFLLGVSRMNSVKLNERIIGYIYAAISIISGCLILISSIAITSILICSMGTFFITNIMEEILKKL